MTYNVIRVWLFMRQRRDVVVGSRDTALTYVVFVFVVAFDVTYVVIFLQNTGLLSVGLILSGGSMVVTVVMHWLFSLVESMRENTRRIVESLMAVIEARDPSLRGHSKHVQDLSLMLYDTLPREKRRLLNRDSLEYAAIFHDLGKIGIPESILNKPGPLTPAEWDVMKMHTSIGVDILKTIASFDETSDWVLYHHERMDGTGYFGISGDQVPLAARIIAVADTFSALYMNRPYAGSVGYDECIAIMREEAGSHLDGELVEAFCEIPREKVLACSPASTSQRPKSFSTELESLQKPSEVHLEER